jgi:hypothetical protein
MRAPLISLLAGVRLYAPLIVLAAATLLVLRAPGGGVGFMAGLVAALALAAHVLVFGAAEARRAFPPIAARAFLGLGALAVLAGAAARQFAYVPQLGEAGLFCITVAALHLVFTVLIGRAPTLRDGDAQ